MNYFTHAFRFVDRPWYAVGTCVPDWLSVVDRKVRMRPRAIEPFLTGEPSPTAELASGVMRHLDDDQWFHSTRGFAEVTGEMTRLFRDALGADDGLRTSFLGHIVTELLLDDLLIERYPERLEAFYALFDQIDPQFVEETVGKMARRPPENLAAFVTLFAQEHILRDYADSQRMRMRLNQVMRRVKLDPLPDSVCQAIEAGRVLVRHHVDDLLPAEHFDFP